MAKNVVRMSVGKTAPAPVETKAAPAKPKAAPAKAEHSARYVGVTSGMSVSDFQNKSLASNFRAKKTDAQLAADWRAEFPRAVPYTEKHVCGVRSVWNLGRHGQDAPPPKKLHSYDVDGTELPLVSDKIKAAVKAAEKVSVKSIKSVAKKIVKKVAPVEDDEDDEEDEDA